jgi:hypothetical protein
MKARNGATPFASRAPVVAPMRAELSRPACSIASHSSASREGKWA